MLITLSGPPGSGTSTIAETLEADFGLEHISGGDIFRALAEERDMSLAAFNELAEENPQIDRDLDRRLQETARERNDIILESRLSGWMAGNHADFRVWLDAPIEVRAERVADREEKTVAQALEESREREASENGRYKEYYGIDIDDLSIYDLVVNTARWDIEAVTAIIRTAVNEYEITEDEGKVSFEATFEF